MKIELKRKTALVTSSTAGIVLTIFNVESSKE